MMAGSHASTAALAGAVLGAAAGGGLVELVWCAAVGAGAGLLPDLDHPEATATRSQGPVSRAACRGVRALSSAVWAATRTPADDGGYRDGSGAHRHLTHTAPACVAAGLMCGAVAVHPAGAAVVLWLLVSLGLRGLGQCLTGKDKAELSSWPTVSLGALLITGVVVGVAPPNPVLLGAVVAVGAWVHVLGDWLTRQGVPLAWPVRVRGKRWWAFRSPLSFAAGDVWQERAVRWACAVGVPALGAWAIM
ncbi:metal-dependent hydrolase [Streptomonospora wellingtoniae]|uniref:Metal-dependent hydrolase n=1 Tax=Streptomonospora wellingtoniae TaxID=3075544 RepID=A0ABU2KU97_9ACTN|nr:metal-dependent hydrolase [Streptomonospora sp. DSM 45055]MDT0302871.1 metal-dependent hydrolase [Streptomonospora sp. DSM 45055]